MAESVITNGQQEKTNNKLYKEKLKPFNKAWWIKEMLVSPYCYHSFFERIPAKNLPLPVSVKQSIAEKREAGIPVPRVLQGKCDCQF